MSSTVRLHMAPPFITKSPRASERSLDALTRMLSGTIDRTIASRDWQIVAKWKAPSAARQHNHCPVQLACRLWERQINQAEWKRNEFQCTENSHSNGFTLPRKNACHYGGNLWADSSWPTRFKSLTPKERSTVFRSGRGRLACHTVIQGFFLLSSICCCWQDIRRRQAFFLRSLWFLKSPIGLLINSPGGQRENRMA